MQFSGVNKNGNCSKRDEGIKSCSSLAYAGVKRPANTGEYRLCLSAGCQASPRSHVKISLSLGRLRTVMLEMKVYPMRNNLTSSTTRKIACGGSDDWQEPER
jgi:hypothetical protein